MHNYRIRGRDRLGGERRRGWTHRGGPVGWLEGCGAAARMAARHHRVHDVGVEGHHGSGLQPPGRPRARRCHRTGGEILAGVRRQRQGDPAGALHPRSSRGLADRCGSALARRHLRPRGHLQGTGCAGAAVDAGDGCRLPRPYSGLPARGDRAPRDRQDRRHLSARGDQRATRGGLHDRRAFRSRPGALRGSDAEHAGAAVRGQGSGDRHPARQGFRAEPRRALAGDAQLQYLARARDRQRQRPRQCARGGADLRRLRPRRRTGRATADAPGVHRSP